MGEQVAGQGLQSQRRDLTDEEKRVLDNQFLQTNAKMAIVLDNPQDKNLIEFQDYLINKRGFTKETIQAF